MMASYNKIKKRQTNNVNAFHIFGITSTRNIKSLNIGAYDKEINQALSATELLKGTKMGMDSHADTTCVNKHAYIESIVEGMTVDAVPFDESIGRLSNLPIVNTIYAYDNPETMRTSLLRFNNAIYIKGMDNALLCPNQAREHGVVIDDVPRHLDHTGNSTFSIIADDTTFPLQQSGPTAYINVRRPTNEELDEQRDYIIDVTDENEWDPYEDTNPSRYNSSVTSLGPYGDIDDWLPN